MQKTVKLGRAKLIRIAIYPGSFDPITNGHLDIATRAAKLFEKLIIGVYATPSKHLLFTTKERVELARQAVAHLPNVEVQSYIGLTVDFAAKVKAQAMVRGLRMSTDFEREFDMGMMNKKLSPQLELVCLMSSLKYQFLSSSLLKEVVSLSGNIDDLVPKHEAEALKGRLEKVRELLVMAGSVRGNQGATGSFRGALTESRQVPFMSKPETHYLLRPLFCKRWLPPVGWGVRQEKVSTNISRRLHRIGG